MASSNDPRDRAGSRSLSPRRIGRMVRDAALGSYGVASVKGPRWTDRLLGWLRLKVPGVDVEATDGLRVDIHLSLVEGVPPPAVATNVAESVRYIVQREIGRSIDRLTVFIDGRPIATEAAGGRGPHSSA